MEGSGYYSLLGLLHQSISDGPKIENKVRKKKGNGFFGNIVDKVSQLRFLFEAEDIEINKIKYNGSRRG